MGTLGQKAIAKITTYAVNHYSFRAIGAKPDLQLRIMIAEQLFQVYATDRVARTRNPKKVVGEIADRVYRHILTTAETDPNMAELRDSCGIREGVKRTYFELANDIQAYEILCAHWGVDTSNHAKAACEEAAYALLEIGHTMNNDRALASGFDRLSKLHNDFQEKQEDLAHTADTEIEFTSDAQLVRKDAQNFSREAIAEYKKKYGKFLDRKDGIEDLVMDENGDYSVAAQPDFDDDDDDGDFFERKEKEHAFRD